MKSIQFKIILADTYNRKGVVEEVVHIDTEATNAYNALVRYRKANPDGHYLTVEKKKYGRRKRWTLLLNGIEYVAEKIVSAVDEYDEWDDHWYIDETCNWRVGFNDGWN